jgi:hypothetical protein
VSFPLILLPEAEEELAVAAAWYERERPGLGEEFFDEVVRALDQSVPLAVVDEDHIVRRVLLRRFPYTVVLLEVPENGPLVVAVVHQSRRPGYWRDRVGEVRRLLDEPDER